MNLPKKILKLKLNVLRLDVPKGLSYVARVIEATDSWRLSLIVCVVLSTTTDIIRRSHDWPLGSPEASRRADPCKEKDFGGTVETND